MRDEDGFTLIEMVIAVMVLGVVIASIAMGMIVMFRTTEETTQRLSESPDLQIAAAYFGSDVQSAQSFTGTCGSPPAGSTTLVTLSWIDPGADPASGAGAGDTTRVASYVLSDGATQNDELVRWYCDGSGPAVSTTLVNYVKPATTPAVECSPAPCGGTTETVRIHTIIICTADASGVCKDDTLEFELKASRRTV